MFLGRDGKYYFDEKNEVVFGDECYKDIYSSAIENLYSTKVINNKVFQIIRGDHLNIRNEEKKTTELTYSPIDITFIGKEKTEKLRIYSLEQFQKALDVYKISFPYTHHIS